MDENKLNRLRLAKRLVGVTLILYAVVFLIINAGNLSADNLGRFFTEMKLGLTSVEASAKLTPDEGELQSGVYKNGLVTLSETELVVYGPGFSEYRSFTVNMLNPVLKTVGKYILAFDRNGTRLYVTDSFNIKFELNSEEKLINAGISSDGRLFVLTESYGYKGRLEVYDKSFTKSFVWDCADEYVYNAEFTDKNEISVITLISRGELTDTVIYTINYASGEELYRTVAEDRIVLSAVKKQRGGLELITDKDIIDLADGAMTVVYTVPEQGLGTFCQTSDCTLVTEVVDLPAHTYNAVLLDYAGNIRFESEISDMRDAATADGNTYFLTSTGIRLFGSDGRELESARSGEKATELLVNSSAVIVIDSGSYEKID